MWVGVCGCLCAGLAVPQTAHCPAGSRRPSSARRGLPVRGCQKLRLKAVKLRRQNGAGSQLFCPLPTRSPTRAQFNSLTLLSTSSSLFRPSDYKSSPMSTIPPDVLKKKSPAELPGPACSVLGRPQAAPRRVPPLAAWGPGASPPARRGRASPRAPGLLPTFPSTALAPRTAVSDVRTGRRADSGVRARGPKAAER